jgi:hypothetical protein
VYLFFGGLAVGTTGAAYALSKMIKVCAIILYYIHIFFSVTQIQFYIYLITGKEIIHFFPFSNMVFIQKEE